MRIERHSQVQHERRFDDIGMTEQGNRLVWMKQPQVIEFSSHSSLHLEHQFPLPSASGATEHIEASPLVIRFQLIQCLALPSAKIDLRQAFSNQDRYPEMDRERLRCLDRPLKRTAIDNSDSTVSQAVCELLCLITPIRV